jgi:hypothetical protein
VNVDRAAELLAQVKELRPNVFRRIADAKLAYDYIQSFTVQLHATAGAEHWGRKEGGKLPRLPPFYINPPQNIDYVRGELRRIFHGQPVPAILIPVPGSPRLLTFAKQDFWPNIVGPTWYVTRSSLSGYEFDVSIHNNSNTILKADGTRPTFIAEGLSAADFETILVLHIPSPEKPGK